MKVKRCDFFYIMTALIAIHQSLMGMSWATTIYHPFRLPVMCLIALLVFIQFVFMKKATGKEIAILLFLFAGIHTSIVVGNTWLIYFFSLVFFLRNKDIRKTIKMIVIISSIVFAITIILFLFQYYHGHSGGLEFFIRSTDTMKRYYIYYSSPSGAAKDLIFITLGWVYLRKENWRGDLLIRLVLLLASFVVYFFTHSEAVFIVPSIFLLEWFEKTEYGLYALGLIRRGVLILCPLISFLFILLRGLGMDHPMPIMDGLLTGRLSLAYNSVRYNGITIFGNKVATGWQSIGYNTSYNVTCDNGYIFCMVCYGLIYLIIFFYVVFSTSTKKLTAREEIVFIVMGLYMFIENRFIDIPASIPLIIVFHSFLSNKRCVSQNTQLHSNQVKP